MAESNPSEKRVQVEMPSMLKLVLIERPTVSHFFQLKFVCEIVFI